MALHNTLHKGQPMEIEEGKVYSIKVMSGEEIVAKVKKVTNTGYILESPVVIIVTQQGMQFIPAMLSTAVDIEGIINQTGIIMIARTRNDVEVAYIEASTGIKVPQSKQIVLG